MFNHASLVRKLLLISLVITGQSFAQSIGGCDSYSPIGGQTVTCTPTITPAATSGVLAPDNQTTIGNSVTVNVQNGTALRINGSLIGIGSNATVNNYGTLESVSNFRYGYGMSSGVNGRSQAGGSTLNNFSTGQIITSGRDADGILIMSTAASSLGNIILNDGSIQTVGIDAIGAHIRSGSNSTSVQNTITNNGTITTSGASAYGIRLQSNRAMGTVTNTGTITTTGLGADGISISNTSNVITINNSGTISTSNARGISILGAASIVNSGTINASSEAIYFDNTSTNTAANSVTLLAGSVIQGGIRFNTNNTQEKLIFDGYTNSNFNNLITGVNIIEATGNSLVVLNNTSVLTLGSGTINVTNGSRLEIASTIADITASSPPIQTSISKIGEGLLVLSGNNTFTGGTTLNSGTLALGNNQALGTGALTTQAGTTLQANTNLTVNNAINLNGATNVNTNGQALTLTGLIAGTGSLNKIGDNTLTLNAVNTYTGNTTVNTGALILNGSIASNTTVMNGARLQGGGSINGSLTNFGLIQPSFNGNPTNLTINGNYTSNGGVFATALYAQTTQLIADTITINGSGNNASGATQVGLINTKLLGNATTGDGILLIQASGGATTGNNTLYYPNRIAVGAFEYQIVKGGANSPNSWYLRSDNSASLEVTAAYGNKPVVDYVPSEQPAQQAAQVVPPVVVPNIAPVPTTVTPEPSQRIEVANYPSIASLARLYMLSTVDSLDQRRSDLAQTNGSLGINNSKTSWGRVLGKTGELRSDDRHQGPALNARTYAIQLGTDVYRHQAADGSQTWIGPYMTLGQASGNTYSSNGSFKTGNVLLQGYALGLNATHITSKGLYVDSLLQATRFSGIRSNSILGPSINTTGWGLTASLETGWKLNMTELVTVTPQAQLIYNNTQMNDTADLYANIGIPNDSSLLGRLGVKVSYDSTSSTGPATQAWFRLSGLSMLSGRNSQIFFQSPSGNSNIAFNAQTPANWLSLDAGLNVALSKSSQLNFTVGYDTSVTNAYRGGYGQIGIQVVF
jgi:outer membrane autotransporter protein